MAQLFSGVGGLQSLPLREIVGGNPATTEGKNGAVEADGVVGCATRESTMTRQLEGFAVVLVELHTPVARYRTCSPFQPELAI